MIKRAILILVLAMLASVGCGPDGAGPESVTMVAPGELPVEKPGAPTPPVTATIDQAAAASMEASATAAADSATGVSGGKGGVLAETAGAGTAVNQPIEAQTPTPAATATNQPPTTAAATSTAASPTSTPRHTVPATVVATAPVPPSPTAGNEPVVDYFRADVAEADPGDSITLEWATSGAETVTLWRLMATGQLGEFWGVEGTGSFDYTIPEHARNRVTFALALTPAEGELGASMTTLAIPLRCLDSWFFGNPPDICPARPVVMSAGAEQYFQGGLMLWSAGEDRIYVLYGDGQSPEWGAFPDEWDPGEAENDPALEPPPGFYQPVRGFGQVWREQPGVRDRLGWALAEEVAYQTAVQRTSYAKYNETYIRAMDGGVWRLEAERSGWGKE